MSEHTTEAPQLQRHVIMGEGIWLDYMDETSPERALRAWLELGRLEGEPRPKVRTHDDGSASAFVAGATFRAVVAP